MGLAFERHGSGPPLVLLHGVGHRRQAWCAVLDRLTPHRDVVLVDLPGHGESPPLQLAGRPVVEALPAESFHGPGRAQVGYNEYNQRELLKMWADYLEATA